MARGRLTRLLRRFRRRAPTADDRAAPVFTARQPPPSGARSPSVSDRDAVPPVQVHGDRLEARSGPVELTPSQAVNLAEEGPESLRRPPRRD